MAKKSAGGLLLAGLRGIRSFFTSPLETRSQRESLSIRDPHLIDILGGRVTSGAVVTESTASTIATVTACVGVLADIVAKLPCKLYRQAGGRRWEDTQHPAHDLIALAPGGDRTPFELRELMQAGVGLGGNGYAHVIRDRYFDPVELRWLRPCDVRPRRGADGMAYYDVEGIGTGLTRADVLHVRWKSLDGISGMSPVRLLRESIGLAMTQRTQTGAIYANGAKFPGFLVSPASQTKDQVESNRKEWRERQEGAENAGKTPILWGGWDYKAIQGMSLHDAEFLDSRKFERSEIEIAYRVPGILIGDNEKTTSWGTGVEQLTLGFLNFCFDPYLVNWEQALNYTLLTADEIRGGSYFKFNRKALLAVALEAQANFFRTMREIGVYSVNDVRRLLEENDISDADGGSDYMQPFNTGAAKAGAAPAADMPSAEDMPAKGGANGKRHELPDALAARMLQ